MSNLYGIESASDCRAKIDELLELLRDADDALKSGIRGQTRPKIAALKSRLEGYFKLGNSERSREKMSSIEQTYFWPAVHKACVNAPNLASPKTWNDGLYLVHDDLATNRPDDR